MADPVVTIEAAQDAKALFAGLTDEQFRRFLVNTLRDNGATRLEITKSPIKLDGGEIDWDFTLRLHGE